MPQRSWELWEAKITRPHLYTQRLIILPFVHCRQLVYSEFDVLYVPCDFTSFTLQNSTISFQSRSNSEGIFNFTSQAYTYETSKMSVNPDYMPWTIEVRGGTVLILNPLILFTGDFMFPRCNLALAEFVSGQRLWLTHLFDATERL